MSETTSSETGYSAFRTSEKYFKSRVPHPDIAAGLIKRRFRKRPNASASYPLLAGQGVLDLSRPVNSELDEVRSAGWKTDEDPTAGRPVRRIKLSKRTLTQTREVAGYIVGDGEHGLFNLVSEATPDRFVSFCRTCTYSGLSHRIGTA
jgi:hypothetical protein